MCWPHRVGVMVCYLAFLLLFVHFKFTWHTDLFRWSIFPHTCHGRQLCCSQPSLPHLYVELPLKGVPKTPAWYVSYATLMRPKSCWNNCTYTLACSRKWSTINLSILDGLGGGLTFAAFPDDSRRPDQRWDISASVYKIKQKRYLYNTNYTACKQIISFVLLSVACKII